MEQARDQPVPHTSDARFSRVGDTPPRGLEDLPFCWLDKDFTLQMFLYMQKVFFFFYVFLFKQIGVFKMMYEKKSEAF